MQKSAPSLDLPSTLLANLRRVVRGRDPALRQLLAAFISGAHVLLEDFPGTGKTTLAKALARSIQAQFKRVQFTPDLLPSDLLGVSTFNPRDQQFLFQQGPIFTEILLADEINRASPRTQSALLEAMAERQVTVEGHHHPLPQLFFVIATQNPVEFRGTYPLPEAQMDRFGVQLSLGYVSRDEEVAILTDQSEHHPLDSLTPCATVDQILLLRRHAHSVRASDELKRYIVDLCAATRSAPGVQLGASPRASLTLLKIAQTNALFDGRSFITPDDIKNSAVSVIAHRLVLDSQSRFTGGSNQAIVQEILRQTPVPA